MKSSYNKTRKNYNSDDTQFCPALDPSKAPGLSKEAKALLREGARNIKLFNQRGKKNFLNKLEVSKITYKDVALLKDCLNQLGGILPSRITKIDDKHQKAIKIAIKRARQLGFLPFPNQKETPAFFE